MKWFVNYKAYLELDKYVVEGYRLYDTHYYGEDGMTDRASNYPQDEWKLEVLSWYKIGKDKYAGVASPIKMEMVFTDKDEANKCWKVIKTCKPCFELLEGMGFRRVA